MSQAFGGMYQVMLFLHIAAVVVAFAPMAIHPLWTAQARREGDGRLARAAGYMAANGRTVHFPALILSGLFGLGMVFSSKPNGSDDNVWGFDQAWVSISFLVWIALCGVVSGMIMPARRKVAAGDTSAEQRADLGGVITTVLFLVMLYLMIWKPGF